MVRGLHTAITLSTNVHVFLRLYLISAALVNAFISLGENISRFAGNSSESTFQFNAVGMK